MEGGLLSYSHLYFRIAAILIDYLIVAVVGLGFAFVLNLLLTFLFGVQLDDQALRFLFLAIVIPVFFLYSVLFESSKLHATPGKLAMGIAVFDSSGSELTAARAFARAIAKTSIFVFIAFPLAGALFAAASILAAVLGGKKQFLHDLVSGTVVLKKKPAVLSK